MTSKVAPARRDGKVAPSGRAFTARRRSNHNQALSY